MSLLDFIVGFGFGALVTILINNYIEKYRRDKSFKELKNYVKLEPEEEQSDEEDIVVDAEVTQETKEQQSIESKKEDVVISENENKS